MKAFIIVCFAERYFAIEFAIRKAAFQLVYFGILMLILEPKSKN